MLTIILLDQLLWRPVLAWADKFKLETVQAAERPRSWFLDLVSRAWIIEQLQRRIWAAWNERLDRLAGARSNDRIEEAGAGRPGRLQTFGWILAAAAGAATLFGCYRAALLLIRLPAAGWRAIAVGLLATFARVAVALGLALLWTVPAGVVFGFNRRLARLLQPLVQVVASIPATAVFPVLILVLLRTPGGLNTASVLLMMMGTQWYLLFNVIAGTMAIPEDLRHTTDSLGAIPQDLRDTTDLLRLSRWERWRTLVLPSLFPYLITGSITASGGAWNASIVAEHVEFAGQAHATAGVGALISGATGRGDYPMLLGATLALVPTVVLINRGFWRRLYRIAEERYRLD